jgi:hypothetical protein
MATSASAPDTSSRALAAFAGNAAPGDGVARGGTCCRATTAARDLIG